MSCQLPGEASKQWIRNHCHPQVWARITLLSPGFQNSCTDLKVSNRTLFWVWNQQHCDSNRFCSIFTVTLPEGNKITSGFQIVGFCLVLFFKYRGMTWFLSSGGIIRKRRKTEDLTSQACTRWDKEQRTARCSTLWRPPLDAFQRTPDFPTTFPWNIWKPK